MEVQESLTKVFMIQLVREATRTGRPPSCSPSSLKPYKDHFKQSTFFPEMPVSQRPKLVVLNWVQLWLPRDRW